MSSKRIILKLSGESFLSDEGCRPFDGEKAARLARLLLEFNQEFEIAVVIGGGNIARGRSYSDQIHRSTADQIGMLATLMNGLFFSEFFKGQAVVLSAVDTPLLMKYRRELALRFLAEKKIVLLVGGAGHPYFTTDTALVLKGIDLDAEELWKATLVDGVYTKDPRLFSDAKKFDSVSLDEAIAKGLSVMDPAAFVLAKAYAVKKIRVFSLEQLSEIRNEKIGTVVYGS